MSSRKCARCGAAGRGSFCARCGASIGPAAAESSVPSSGERWGRRAAVLGVGFLLATVVWVLRDGSPATPLRPAQPPAALPAGGTPPDLSTLTPREQFDRLYNRVLRAAEQADTATVARFSPMAFLAYGQLDAVDADARYHAAVLRLHVQGDTGAALRLADTIQMASPRHLFAFLIRGTAARLAGDAPLRDRADADFRAAWDAEMRAGRSEYRDHLAMLEQFRELARRAEPGKAPP